MGIFSYFQGDTHTDILNKLTAYKAQAEILLGQIQVQEYSFLLNYGEKEDLYNNLRKNEGLKRPWIQGSEELTSLQYELIQARNELNLNNLYLQGYKLLNEIGHYINSEVWNYTIVLFGAKSYTFSMGMEEFLQFGYFTTEGFRLADKNFILNNRKTILEKMGNIQQRNYKEIEWDTEEGLKYGYSKKGYQDYSYVINRAKSILAQGNANVGQMRTSFNAGEKLEGFLSYMESSNRQEILNLLSNIKDTAYRKAAKHLGGAQFDELRNNVQQVLSQINQQTNRRGFWSGGDTKQHGQIKGENASIFSFNTIKNQLQKFIFLGDRINFDKLKEKIDISKNDATTILSNKIDEVLNGLMANFNATSLMEFGARTQDYSELLAAIDDLYS